MLANLSMGEVILRCLFRPQWTAWHDWYYSQFQLKANMVIFFKLTLFDREGEREGERAGEHCVLIHLLPAIAGSWEVSQVSHVRGRDPPPWATTCHFSGCTFVGFWMGSRSGSFSSGTPIWDVGIPRVSSTAGPHFQKFMWTASFRASIYFFAGFPVLGLYVNFC